MWITGVKPHVDKRLRASCGYEVTNLMRITSYEPHVDDRLRARTIKLRAASCLKEVYLTQGVSKVVLQKSTPPQIRQLVLYYY